MYKCIIIACIFFISFTSYGQDANEILRKTNQKCRSINSGYYEMNEYSKYASENDTLKNSYNCFFQKIAGDSLSPVIFHNQKIFNDNSIYGTMYTGEEYISYVTKDSTGVSTSKALWLDEVKSLTQNNDLYSPVTNNENNTFPNDSDLIINKHKLKLLGEEKVNNIDCYHIQMDKFIEKDSSSWVTFLRAEFNYWISKKDYLLLQYTTNFDIIMNNDTMYQYQKFELVNFLFDNKVDVSKLSVNSVPTFIKLKEYSPEKEAEPLLNDTTAPEWSLISVDGDKVSLSDFKGKYVLLDFFYKSCMPCMKALPVMQSLYEKYKEKGLVVIGIDPYDTNTALLKKFLSKKGVTYPVLLGSKELSSQYRVSGYPSIFLIDKTGKIIHSSAGYGDGTEAELDELMQKNLR